ncbi:hypothetical protein Q4Q39_19695 [Flavivirga amylovorans]|uniref:Uncharacterized protein n=1 Tax=Flavivirga amylovorans TaxID=870486 RepID=A0ABT8X7G6_9FLAO|nr:hypothetical protein [Flavivirga amylovorans]MDO5989633.1 hypothetical protein [Flavivirga amylovorans]
MRATIRYNYYVVNKNDTLSNDVRITLRYSHYDDFDSQNSDRPVPYFKVNKSFLKRNKDIIITLDTMEKMGYSKTKELMQEAKTIYLIDATENTKKEITIKQVRYSFLSIE